MRVQDQGKGSLLGQGSATRARKGAGEKARALGQEQRTRADGKQCGGGKSNDNNKRKRTEQEQWQLR